MCVGSNPKLAGIIKTEKQNMAKERILPINDYFSTFLASYPQASAEND